MTQICTNVTIRDAYPAGAEGPQRYGPSASLLAGRVLDGRYRLGSLIGEGAMGTVYRAIQLSLERTVAIKVLRPQLAASADAVDRFRREALTVAHLSHPNIVDVFDAGHAPGAGAYLVMEYLSGRSLDEELLRRRRLPVGEALDLMRQVCSAVHAVHAAGIIHRDLKPANVFLENGLGALRVKILDFGIAKLRDAVETSEEVGGFLGTPLYMSPEQCMGLPSDARSDIYSLGCLFYETVAGRPPFRAGSIPGVLFKQAAERPKRPSAFAPHLPPELDAILLRALAKNPEDRFQTADELGQILELVGCPDEPRAEETEVDWRRTRFALVGAATLPEALSFCG